ncbi:DUF2523 domain-containing protein [Cupriavidus basilensis]|uniref:DUF2523 domain-containing protein n=1 Tax=Cupriavidus basilensis TaxID=68895 RepID=UPI00157A74D2|nr:DUF2523 domain-containing protein [Cupriavidus basilensis]NUA30184.1 DUF2523 domain-containing protein [Cupriavidus basilensis]
MNFDAVINAISAFAGWLFSLIAQLVAALFAMMGDVFVALGDAFLSAFAALIVVLPAPAFLQSVSLQTSFAQIGSDTLYFLGVFNIGPGITLLGSAFAFRMLRKVVTLFQW